MCSSLSASFLDHSSFRLQHWFVIDAWNCCLVLTGTSFSRHLTDFFLVQFSSFPENRQSVAGMHGASADLRLLLTPPAIDWVYVLCELWGNYRWMGVLSTSVCKDEIVHNSPDIIPSFFAPFINASTRFLCQLCSIFVTDKSLLANNARSFHVLKTRIVSLNNEEKNLSARLKGLISVLMPTHRIETCVDSV